MINITNHKLSCNCAECLEVLAQSVFENAQNKKRIEMQLSTEEIKALFDNAILKQSVTDVRQQNLRN